MDFFNDKLLKFNKIFGKLKIIPYILATNKLKFIEMKTTNVVGLFHGKAKSQKIPNSLVIAGFDADDIIIEENNNDVFLLSVSVRDKSEDQMVHNIFSFYRPYHVYKFNFEISNGEELRRLVEVSAKMEVYQTPEIRHHNHYHEGMNSEVAFGR